MIKLTINIEHHHKLEGMIEDVFSSGGVIRLSEIFASDDSIVVTKWDTEFDRHRMLDKDTSIEATLIKPQI